MNHPVEALRAARDSLAEGGSVLVADERVAERFTAPGDEIERFNYGWSVLHCLPVGTARGGLRRDRHGDAHRHRPRLRHRGRLRRVEVLPIEHDFWRFYRLDARRAIAPFGVLQGLRKDAAEIELHVRVL